LETLSSGDPVPPPLRVVPRAAVLLLYYCPITKTEHASVALLPLPPQ
jgi:hypothetical protein